MDNKQKLLETFLKTEFCNIYYCFYYMYLGIFRFLKERKQVVKTKPKHRRFWII